jgi:hypothetical protein
MKNNKHVIFMSISKKLIKIELLKSYKMTKKTRNIE